jgi:hypothetical protein
MIAHPAFDTLKFVQKLKASGMPEPQAIALTEAQNEAFMESTNHMLPTKADLLELKQELKHDIADLSSHLKVHNWMISIMLTGIGALVLKAFFA